jgi:DNA-binding transcriptional MerR regulator
MQKAPKWSPRRAEKYVRRVTADSAAGPVDAEVFGTGPVGAEAFGEEMAMVAGLFRPPRKLYRVSEIADHLGLSRQTIHNYATAGLISEESHTVGGQRLFGEAVFAELAAIQRLKATHRLQDIRRILAGRQTSAGAPAAGTSSATELPPPGVPTRAGPAAASPENQTDRAATGPDIAVRAPSEPPQDRPSDPGRPDLRHARETPEDDRHRG